MILKLAKWTFLLLITVLPLARPSVITVGSFNIQLVEVIFLISGLLLVLALIFRQTALKFSYFYLFIGIYVGQLLLSVALFTSSVGDSLKIFGHLYLVGLAVLTHNLVNSIDFLKKTVYAWLVGSFVLCFFSLVGCVLFYLGYQTPNTNYFLAHFGSLPSGYYPRLYSLSTNFNLMCNYLNITIVLVLLAGRVEWVRGWVAKLLVILTAFAAIFTISPGLGGIGLSCGLWYWSDLKSRGKLLAAKICLATGLFIAAFFLVATVISPNTDNTSADLKIPFIEKTIEPSVRVLVWQNTLATVVEHPIFGKGVGTNPAHLEYVVLSGQKQVLEDAHNVWLSVLGQNGIVGLAAFLALMLYLLFKSNSVGSPSGNGSLFAVALWCAFIGAFWYQGLAGSYEDARHLWVLFGLIAGVSGFNEEIESRAKLVVEM